MNSITDVGGIRVGHYQRLDPDASLGAGWACGVTVVLPPPGTVGAVDCRGGAPGTRETDLLDPANSVRFVDALLLAGGSAYGLAAADGVMRWLEEHRRGVAMDSGVVPIVPGAVIFDLPVGGWNCRPTADFGYSACAAAGVDVAVGTVGVGVGARAGALKGGVGTASATLQSGVTVGVLAVVNAAGNVVDPATGLPWMADLVGEFALRAPPAEQIAALAQLSSPLGAFNTPFNTTIGVIACDAALSPAACRRIAIAAHDGLARTIRPAHTPLDGDTVFALATGAVAVPPEAGVPGLWGVIFAPLLHANWHHLMANTIPLLVLGFLMTLAGLSRFVWATAIIWILGGLGTWLIGNVGSSCGPTDHIGASGLIFGWLAFLLVFGLFVRKGWDIVIGLVVLFVYGGILLGAMPVLGQCGGVSWQGHLSGAVAGVVAAYLLSAPERKARALKRAGARSGHPKL